MNEVPFWYIRKSKASSLVTGCVNTKFTIRKLNTVIDIYNMTLEYYKHRKQISVEEYKKKAQQFYRHGAIQHSTYVRR